MVLQAVDGKSLWGGETMVLAPVDQAEAAAQTLEAIQKATGQSLVRVP